MVLMTAMESIKDENMLILDLASGVAGLLVCKAMGGKLKGMKLDKKMVMVSLMVLVSRVLVDAAYHYLVSETDKFGGSDKELVLSSAVWFVLMMGVMAYKPHDAVMLYLCTIVSMMAISKVFDLA